MSDAEKELARIKARERDRQRRWRERHPDKEQANNEARLRREKAIRARYRAEYDLLLGQGLGHAKATLALKDAHIDEWRTL